MSPDLVRILDDLRSHGFAELAGSHVAADLVLPESLINRALAVLVEGARGRVTSVSVRIEAGGRCHVDLGLALRFLPSVGIEAEIERQPDLPASPELVLKWRTRVPGLAKFAGGAVAFFRDLPPGVRLEGDRIMIDLRLLFARAGAGDLLPLLAELRVATRPQALDLHILAGV